jgi:class 3 adenylate cyclase
MHTLLDHFFELALGEVHRFEGTVNQFLGDGFMALFGAPLAHEDHARRALLAALAVQQRLHESDEIELSRLGLRMRVNTGTVVVGKIGDNLRMDYTAVGDTTHLAARLQQGADPETIRVSPATQRAASAFFEFRPLGKQLLKGIAEPLELYELVKKARPAPETDAPARSGGIGSPLVGRDAVVLPHVISLPAASPRMLLVTSSMRR